jgi:hypothetical protein
MFDKPLLGTDTKKIKMSWVEYIFTHLVPTAFQTFNNNFVMWRDLITGDYEKYKLLKDDDAYQECYDWFWCSINLDETYPKFFLEELLQMSNDVATGKVKTVPFTKDMFDDLKDLVGDLIDDVNLDDELEED